VSLLGSGVWAMGHAVALSLLLDQPMEAPPLGGHGSPVNPLTGMYKTADNRWLQLVMLQPTKFWADVCRHVGRPELADDPRFATTELVAQNTEEGVKILREAFAGKTLEEWTQVLTTLSGPWAPVQDTVQVGADPQVRANEYILQAGEIELVANPVQFDVEAPELRPFSEFAADTEAILLELGLDWEKIIALKEAQAVA
jgi:crotonobetainyl-CoA:carnitine CoA-transferase CaiB-like acyl-CoA transferase